MAHITGEETHRNLEAIWLLRQLSPDFKTIADFRRDNRNGFRAAFRQFVRLFRELDLYWRELIALHGTPPLESQASAPAGRPQRDLSDSHNSTRACQDPVRDLDATAPV